jgi:hypothetical protein
MQVAAAEGEHEWNWGIDKATANVDPLTIDRSCSMHPARATSPWVGDDLDMVTKLQGSRSRQIVKSMPRTRLRG